MELGTTILENLFAVSTEVEHMPIVWPYNLTLGYMHSSNECLFPPEDMYENIDSSTIHNNFKLATV